MMEAGRWVVEVNRALGKTPSWPSGCASDFMPTSFW